VPRKIHINTASEKRKTLSKNCQKILNNLPQGFTTAVSLDESFFFFFFDSLIRKVWISKNKRPMVTVTGSHRHSCLFGVLSLDGKKTVIHSDSMTDSMMIHSIIS
jgi:hypothetical protein